MTAPLRFEALYDPKIWGGTRLSRILGKDCPAGTGESFELLDRPEYSSIVREGAYQGRRIAELIREDCDAFLGQAHVGSEFNLLFKYIDANDMLSLQLHPNAQSAARLGGEAKEECWYVVAAEPEAYLYLGFAAQCTPDKVGEAIREQRVASLLQKISVQVGDFFHIPPGTVHAIGAGILLAEIQTNSRTTYRLYDWGRLDAEGQSRELHLAQGLQSLSCHKHPQAAIAGLPLGSYDYDRRLLLSTDAFQVEKLHLTEAVDEINRSQLYSVMQVVSGCGRMIFGEAAEESMEINLGDTLFIPASMEYLRLEPEDYLTVLKIRPVCS